MSATSSSETPSILRISAVGDSPIAPSNDGRYHLECWRDYILSSSASLELPRGLARRTSQPDDAEQQFLVNFGDYTGLLCVANSEFLIESTENLNRLDREIVQHASLRFQLTRVRAI